MAWLKMIGFCLLAGTCLGSFFATYQLAWLGIAIYFQVKGTLALENK